MKFKYLIAIILGAAVADITILNVHDLILPKKTLSIKSKQNQSTRLQLSEYNSIVSRNILSADGFMPKALVSDSEGGQNGKFLSSAKPVLSQLPIKLIGTIVHANPERSVASVELKSKNRISPFSNNDVIDNIARVKKITRRQLIFQNLNNNRLEYIEMVINAKISYELTKKSSDKKSSFVDGISRNGNKFSIKRSTLEKHLKNLPKLLQEARAVPNRDPLTGEINGFRILDILPGSLFESLGVKRLDVIKGVNGENIDNPSKAMEAFNRLKGSNNIKITINRSGKNEEYDYSVE